MIVNKNIKLTSYKDTNSAHFISWFLNKKNLGYENFKVDSTDLPKLYNTINNVIYGYFLSNKLEGIVRLQLEDPKFIWLSLLAVNPMYRGMGFGNALITEAINQYGNRPIKLTVTARNKAAISLYEKHGFVITEKFTDNNIDGYVMIRKPTTSKLAKTLENMMIK